MPLIEKRSNGTKSDHSSGKAVRRSASQSKIDDQAFPICVKFTTPDRGFGNRLIDLHDWLETEVGRGHYATHPAPALGSGALGIYLRDIELTRAFVLSFSDQELACGTDNSTYSFPAQWLNWQGEDIFGVCNLYSMTKGQAAIRDLVKVWQDRTGNMPPLPGIFPNQHAPVVWNDDGGRVLSMMRWGMPSPAFVLKNRKTDSGVTNVRNIKSPH
ncbi:MAG: hypothetical protein RIE24_05405 [Silicimonas sp.]|uniref:hypothetical protein n=1 Tax=Sphingopyxis sp. TaxID=1908224 RepID=UPI0032F07FE1